MNKCNELKDMIEKLERKKESLLRENENNRVLELTR